MEKKVLIPVADCRRTLHALKYGVHATSFVNNLYFVLFHVQPMISLYLEDEAKKDLHVRAKLNKLKAKNKAAAQAILEKFKGQMLELGVDESRIELKTQVRQLGVAQDIIEFAHENLFDAILIGRRRISGIHKIFASSVSSSVLERSQVLPVWMVDGVPSSCKIMVAVDGSESALRAIDHVGFMVSKNPDIELTLVHITNTAQNYCEIDLNISPDPELVEIVEKGDRACIDRFYPLAKKKLMNMGLSEDQIGFESIKGERRLGKSLVNYAQTHGYDTIVIGRTGIDRAFFMGSVSRQVINRFSEAALWVVN